MTSYYETHKTFVPQPEGKGDITAFTGNYMVQLNFLTYS